MFPEIARDDIFRLETERLWLRWPRTADVEAFCLLAGDPEVATSTARIPHPYEPSDAEAFIRAARAENGSGSGLCLALTLKRQPNEAIGVIGLHGSAPRAPAMLGFWLGRPYWGQGLMSEAVGAFVDLAFGLTSIERIVSSVLPSNAASLRVHEAMGFIHTGRGLFPAPARGGEVEVEMLELRRGAIPTTFASRRPRLKST
ncbi:MULTISPECIES: GNAT family N-acetyltransferase [Methylosinus]|uniref:N-acetyltransferase n=1 Tax=Methylosinus trichosporium (strain ATCC 35070 / NCIMB 11131 / UNIQEM 75 / OB3b) TaxID=595536 RepID=A0A2D2D0Y4_METT3|nr:MULTISPECIES: GNAT family N-acetyltransferase [Methylosinus]ATQ68646.1 N-acetyltransferase [Methylosinus trichosporium OB3b]OBS53190.1 GCN5 family acetyltransferase [Methylosinus sp. 3S-1]